MDAGDLPKRQQITIRRRRKFKIKNSVKMFVRNFGNHFPKTKIAKTLHDAGKMCKLNSGKLPVFSEFKVTSTALFNVPTIWMEATARDFFSVIFVCLRLWLSSDNYDTKRIFLTRTNLMHTCLISQYVYYNPLYVSSIICSSSGGWAVLMQHLVSSLSVSGRPVNRTATDWEWRYQMLHQYSSTSWWWAHNVRNI